MKSTRLQKLKKNSDFKTVFSCGESVATRGFVLYRRNNQTGNNRVGFVTSKKLGNAVTRNRVKRLMRETYRLYATNIKQGYDLVFIARQPSAGYDYAKAATEMELILKRGGLFTLSEKRQSGGGS